MSLAESAPNTTSSIGAVWPPRPASNNRLKGFYPEVVETNVGLDEFSQEFWDSHTTDGDRFDRTTVRFVGSSAVLRAALEQGMPIEATMPVAGSSDLQMVYVGINSGDRVLTPEYLLRHQTVLRQSREAVRHASLHDSKEHDIRTAVGSRMTARDMHSRFMGLYETFGFSESDVTELLENPENTIAYLQNAEGEILSTCLAERGVVDLGKVSLSLYEITEAVTRADARGNGYYTAVSGALGQTVIRELVRPDLENGSLAAVYGESNLSSPGVISAARRNGRVIAADYRQALSPFAGDSWGILQQNYKVNDGTDQREYNDFALSYLPL